MTVTPSEGIAKDLRLGAYTERLEADLADACKVRDEWCAEYTRVRDELELVKSDIELYSKLLRSNA